jgi:hypothetical protein
MILRYLAEGEALDPGWKKQDPGSWIREEIVKYDPALPCRGRNPGSGMEKTGSRILDPGRNCEVCSCVTLQREKPWIRDGNNRTQDPGSGGRNCEV